MIAFLMGFVRGITSYKLLFVNYYLNGSQATFYLVIPIVTAFINDVVFVK